MLAEKIKHGWGYTVGAEPPNVVLQATGKDSVISIAHWPTANPPTIAEIEAVVLPEPTPQADWASFVAGIPSLTFYASKILAGPPSNLFTALTHAIDAQDTERINELLPAVQTAFSLTDEDSAEFQNLADEHNIDITIP